MKFKSLLATTLLVAGFTTLNAQVVPEKKFNVDISNQLYAPLDESRALEIFSASTTDFDIENPIDLPINFNYCGTDMNTFHITYTGGLSVNNHLMMENEYYFGNILGFMIGDEFSPNSLDSKLLMDTISVDGNRIFVYEVKNFSTLDDSITFSYQIWLHEGSNIVELRMGEHNVPEGAFSNMVTEIYEEDTFEYMEAPLMVGLIYNNGDAIDDDPDSWNFHFLNPTSSDTIINMSSLEDEDEDDFPEWMNPYLWNSFPSSGTVIRFTPIVSEDTSTSIPNPFQMRASIFPNPSTGIFTIQSEDLGTKTNLIVMDMNGKIIFKDIILEKSYDLDLSKLAAGNYVLQLANDTKRLSRKLTKK